jgi:hypothetical protein
VFLQKKGEKEAPAFVKFIPAPSFLKAPVATAVELTPTSHLYSITSYQELDSTSSIFYRIGLENMLAR